MSSAAHLREAAGSAITSPVTQRFGMHALAFIGVGLGGALTGYLASGRARGAATGALTHEAVYALTGAVLGGGRLSTRERVFYALWGLSTGAGAGYLFLRTRRKR